MVKTTFTAIITGEKDLSYFDTFVQDWLAAGGQQTLDEMEKLYPKQ
jgi:putative aldouronate transport system substrate-binding protein